MYKKHNSLEITDIIYEQNYSISECYLAAILKVTLIRTMS